MTISINVGIMGFSPQELRKFKKIFALAQKRERGYILKDTAETEAVEMLIVNTLDEFAPQQQHAYRQRHQGLDIPVVKVGRGAVGGDDNPYIRGMLLPSRVLPVLDGVEILPANKTLLAQGLNAASAEIPETAENETEKKASSNGFFDVLVVDDSEMMQKTVQLELEKSTIPLTVEFADTGEMALEKIAAKKYDFIFLDVMMPGMDGFETCAEIRKMEGMAKTPIIMLTSKSSALDEVKGLMAGCSTYLTKPFQHDEFQKMLERIMHWVKEFNDGN